MHYLIFGAGAVGTYLGAHLALSGQPTTFLARPLIGQALRESGANLLGKDRTLHLPAPSVIFSLDELPLAPDIILLTVKVYDLHSAAKSILKRFGHEIPVICLTNGVGGEAILADILGREAVIPATITTAVERMPSYSIRIQRERGMGISGSHPLLSQICDELRAAGLDVRLYRDPERMKWSKLLINMVCNATSAIIGWTPGQIFDHHGLSALEIAALREAVGVMRHAGLRPQNLPKVPVALLSLGLSLPGFIFRPALGKVISRGRGDKLPSFHDDIGQGRSEIEWLNGAVVKAAERSGLTAPANHALLEIMRKLVQDGSLHTQYRDQPERLLEAAALSGVPGFQRYNAGRS